MGNDLGAPQPQAKKTFSSTEVKRLRTRFRKLDADDSGTLSVDEIMKLPNITENPLVRRVVDVFDTNGDGELDFQEFLNGLAQVANKADRRQKLAFAFRIYDIDKDGYISNGELFQALKTMVGSNLKDAQLQQAVDKTIMIHHKDGDGRIGFKEFCEAIGSMDFQNKLNLPEV